MESTNALKFRLVVYWKRENSKSSATVADKFATPVPVVPVEWPLGHGNELLNRSSLGTGTGGVRGVRLRGHVFMQTSN